MAPFMPPTIVLIRHAQALHNVANKWPDIPRITPADLALQDYTIRDPPLSDLGVQQCNELRSHLKTKLPIIKDVGLIVVSPMRRTLQTAQLALDWLIEAGVPVQPRGEWQENSNAPCDTGSPIDIVSLEHPQFNFETVFREYPAKTGRWAFTEQAIRQRGIDSLGWLKKRPEKVIVVVSHSGFLRVGIAPSKWSNADYRIFDFEVEGEKVVQWKLTEDNGGGMGRSPKGLIYPKPSDFEIIDYKDHTVTAQTGGEPVEEVPQQQD